ncbi:hypothetical protein [Rickettsia bellii]|uniref:Putative leucine-rich repeat protein n=1 Tax=Rickettsia bellii str. RML An4 TaxID=1359193 RepID=A0A0F3QB59_RICBE|nr:hypothetical protein [Rickettsia bellii]KJV89487.1 putative leucine-rich repeat protein [Rickettsia bellii str. RML An4]
MKELLEFLEKKFNDENEIDILQHNNFELSLRNKYLDDEFLKNLQYY